MMKMPKEFLDAIETVLLKRGGRRTKTSGIEFRCFEEARHQHGDRAPSAWWSSTKHCWSCRACGEKGGASDAAQRLDVPPPPRTDYREVKRWQIRDAPGVVVADHVRLEAPNGRKKVVWERRGKPGLQGLRVTALPLYGAPELAAADPTATVVVTEGEPARDALHRWGVLAVGTVTGAGTIPDDAVLRELCGHDVVLWPDRDTAGHEHMTRLDRRLARMGTTARWVAWSDAPEGGDAVDFTGDAAALAALLAAAAPYAGSAANDETATPAPAEESGLPTIVVTNRPLRDVTADALAALATANDPPRIFARGGELCRWRRDEKHVPFIERLSDAALRGRLGRAANFVTRTGGLRHIAPPLDVVHDLAALDDIVHAVPALDGIVEVPPLRPDGSVRTTPGYDAETRLVYAPPPGFHVPPIPDVPTPRDILAARALLAELLVDFPFSDEAMRANGWAAVLTPFIRPLVSTCVPIAVLDKPRQGTGASLLAFAIVQLVTGRPVATLPAPDREEEWAKLITAALLDGRTFVLIDNVVASLHSAHLARAITTPVWEERLLGESRNVRVPQRAVWMVTGNNICLGKDLPRRAYWIRLDAGLEYPEDRPAETFRHPDLLDWIGRERPRLVAAVLTLARHWVAEGYPKASTPPFGSFESWAATVGSILALVGIEGFLTNRIAMRSELDDDELAWRSFLAAWFATFGTDPVRVRDLVDAIRATTDDPYQARSTPLRDPLPDSLGDPDDRYLGVRLGTALRERRDRVLGDFRLRRAKEDTHANANRWRLEHIPPASSGGSAHSPTGYTRERVYQNSTESESESGRRNSSHYPHYSQREPGEDDDQDDEEVLG